MSSLASLPHPDQRSDLPTDFERFVAEHRGLQEPEAARLLVEWISTYQPQRPRPSVAPHYAL
ncbi:MAG: hypothetical protein EOO73_17285 [Myxococcales bacterium]|nr:MAG: hypothetical protein EOO73_17285 [Myxococcales bacterium]